MRTIELNKIYNEDNISLIKRIPGDFIDLTVTSPPYDNLRDYKGYTFNFETLAKELYRVTKPGGVIVWIVADATINGSETGTSFRQALHFMDVGFNLHDTMIWNKGTFTAVGSLRTRYAPVFEYMFVLTKGKIKTFNPLKDKKNLRVGKTVYGAIRQRDGSFKPMSNPGKPYGEFGQRYNVWNISNPGIAGTKHPATFPLQLAKDHIISWSNKGDIVFDPFMGSGTTAIAALDSERQFIGAEIAREYVDIANQRIKNHTTQTELFDYL